MAQFTEVLNWVQAERERQNQRYETKSLPDSCWLAVMMEEVGEVAKALLEGSSRTDLIDELTQVAAVAVAWLEDRG